MCSKSYSVAPEGLESFGLLGNNKSSVTSFIGYVNPRWVTDYQSFQVYFGTPTYKSGYLTYGGSITIGNGFSDRNAYFLRHDFLLLSTTSLSLKILHEDYSYIPSAHDSVGLEINSYVPWSNQSGLYFAAGVFNKWNKFSWNGPYWIPLYLNTNDTYAFFSGLLGLKYGFGQKNFWTIDASSRDVFSYYTLDHVGFDLTVNFSVGQNSYLRLLSGLRTSAFWMGTMTPASYHFFLGIYSQ